MSTLSSMLLEAADLITEEPGENEEYDRAIVELVCRTIGISTDYRDAIEALLRGLKQ